MAEGQNPQSTPQVLENLLEMGETIQLYEGKELRWPLSPQSSDHRDHIWSKLSAFKTPRVSMGLSHLEVWTGFPSPLFTPRT